MFCVLQKEEPVSSFIKIASKLRDWFA